LTWLRVTGWAKQLPPSQRFSLGYLRAALRPKGDRASRIFRADWENGRAMYAAWGRVALQGHSGWPQQHPRSAWNGQRDLAFILSSVFEVLNADDCLGI
jgi:hypothetical protein